MNNPKNCPLAPSCENTVIYIFFSFLASLVSLRKINNLEDSCYLDGGRTPVNAYTGRLRHKRVPYGGVRHIKG